MAMANIPDWRMWKPWNKGEFAAEEYQPIVDGVTSIGFMRQPLAYTGDEAVIYRGTWLRLIGSVEALQAETPDGYATPQQALRAAARFYCEATAPLRRSGLQVGQRVAAKPGTTLYELGCRGGDVYHIGAELVAVEFDHLGTVASLHPDEIEVIE